MTVHLHTRSLCDNCPMPATVESMGVFLCDACAAPFSSCGGVESRHAFDPETGQAGDTSKLKPVRAAVAPGPHDSIPTPMQFGPPPASETSVSDLDVRSAPLSFSPIGPDLDAAVTALETQWLRCGISLRNSTTFRVAAASAMPSGDNSFSVTE